MSTFNGSCQLLVEVFLSSVSSTDTRCAGLPYSSYTPKGFFFSPTHPNLVQPFLSVGLACSVLHLPTLRWRFSLHAGVSKRLPILPYARGSPAFFYPSCWAPPPHYPVKVIAQAAHVAVGRPPPPINRSVCLPQLFYSCFFPVVSF